MQKMYESILHSSKYVDFHFYTWGWSIRCPMKQITLSFHDEFPFGKIYPMISEWSSLHIQNEEMWIYYGRNEWRRLLFTLENFELYFTDIEE